MDDKIRVGHPFYFPTQAVLVDDDPDFLEGISLMLNKSLSYKLFQSASSALKPWRGWRWVFRCGCWG